MIEPRRIKVYTKPGCQPCRATKVLMDNLGVEYDTVDITEDESAFRFLTEALGVQEVPLVYLPDGTFWTGFRDERIKELVK
ncbi:hypothetical protein N806_29730 [Rhodococcus sp. P27]|nr:hypothetical protein N806_29730 [Rhodococcus sp. P27]